MKRILLTAAALGILVVAYQSTAMGAGGTATGHPGVRFLSADRCDLKFEFAGFAPGTKGRLELRIDGKLHTIAFTVPANAGIWDVKLHHYLGHPHSMVMVDYRIAAQGMDSVLTGNVMANCDCGGGGGGGGGGGNNGGGGGSDAGSAAPITSQPGFAG